MDEPRSDAVTFHLETAGPTGPFSYTTERVRPPPRILAFLEEVLREVWRRITRTEEVVMMDFEIGLPPSHTGPSLELPPSASETYSLTIVRKDP